jgi:chorismate dehydratase
LNKIKVGAVSYLNTKPLLYGFEQSGFIDKIELVQDFPARIAAMLLNDEIDIGLIPVAVIPENKAFHIVSDYCIGAVNEVASVCLFSEVPMEQIETVILDYQSRTSVQLCKILLKHFWKKEVVFKNAELDFRNQISRTTAAVVIGDRAFEQRLISPFVYDLTAAWKGFTGLPFVFAAWVANKKIDEVFLMKFNEANAYGLQHIAEVVANIDYPLYDLTTYYTQNISYNFDALKQEGLNAFLNYLKESKQ